MCMNEFQSEIKIFDDSDIYFSDESGNKTIGFVTPDELLDNAAVWSLYMLASMFNLCRKSIRKTATSHKVYKPTTSMVW